MLPTRQLCGEITGRTSGLDIALSNEGNLHGRVSLASGQAAAGVYVRLRNATRKEIRTVTDATGRFSIGPIRGGAYAVNIGGPPIGESVGGSVFVVRAWQAGTAPPVAQARGMFVLEEITRGQSPARHSFCGGFFRSDQFLLAATITSAIVIPIAVYANRHDEQPGS